MLSTVPPAKPSTSVSLSVSWPRQWITRVRHDFWLKTIGITAFIWIFFIAYFWLLRNPVREITVLPLTVVDDWIAFAPWSLGFYLTLWVYVTFAPSLIVERNRLIRYGIAAAGLCLTGLAIFLFWPTAVPDGLADGHGHPGFALLKGIDASGNAFPSLHVATAVFSAVWLDWLLREMRGGIGVRLVSAAWAIAIVYSTMATKQHIFLDALSGTALGLVVAYGSRPFVDGRRENQR